jgi:hypothetical protein
MKYMIKHYRHIQHCDFWDEMNQTCIFERTERIIQPGCRDNEPAWRNPASCFDEMD